VPTLTCQSCWPWVSRPYTESFSVATTMTPSTAIGDAYTAPSSLSDLTTFREPLTSGMARDTPSCAGAPWYIG
jgi:hypothetical protein